MIALVDVLVALAWTFGANGHLVERPAGASDSWPAAWLEPVADRARIVFHDREDWAMAFYLPPEPTPAEGGAGDAGSDAPRLVLYAPYYLATDGLAAPRDMPVDVAEYYFHALLELALDLEPAVDEAWGARVERRAEKLMAEVPAVQRRSAYLSALADFGAHVLSIANEIDRVARRRRAAGGDVCRLLGSPASLFGMWRRSFEGAAYRGRYLLPAEEGSSPRWATSRLALERRDKDALARLILGVEWSGDPARDFAWLCPEG